MWIALKVWDMMHNDMMYQNLCPLKETTSGSLY